MKLPKIRRLPSGMYHIQLRLDGESISITESTKAKCEAEARYIKSQHKVGKRKKPVGADMTLKQAIDAYIQSRDGILSPSTISGYEAIRETRFKTVMNKQLKDITDWQAVCNDEARICSAKTLKNAWGLIGSVLRYHKLDVPKPALPQVVKKEIPWLEPEQIGTFLDAIKDDRCEIQALLALHGLRRSEMQAIDWSKIDFDKGHIVVSGAVITDRKNHLIKKDTNKNVSSQRIVPLMIPRLTTILKEASATDRVIADCHPHTVWERINKACKRSNLPLVGVQGLRHSFASLCYHLGLSERETMDLGGWDDANTMRKIYIHLARRDKQKAAAKLKDFYVQC